MLRKAIAAQHSVAEIEAKSAVERTPSMSITYPHWPLRLLPIRLIVQLLHPPVLLQPVPQLVGAPLLTELPTVTN